MNPCPHCKQSHYSTACPPPAGEGLGAMPCSASLIANTNQDEIDWSFFAGKFEGKYGFAPNRRDSGHQEYYHWFTVGAHAEFMGRLNSLPNAQSEATPPEPQ